MDKSSVSQSREPMSSAPQGTRCKQGNRRPYGKGSARGSGKDKTKRLRISQKELEELEGSEETLSAEIKKRMMVIPNIIGDDVPIGKDDSENVELQRFGEPYVPPFEIPYHVDIMEKLHGIDLDSALKTSGNGFYHSQEILQDSLCGALICARFYDRQRVVDAFRHR